MREDKIHKIEVIVEAVTFHDDEVFLLKRAPTRKLFPNMWECGGGDVEPGESFEEAAIRQMREEAGMIVEPLAVISAYEISSPQSDQKKIPGVFFACKFIKYLSGKSPAISNEHTEWMWQPVSKISEVNGIPTTIVEAIKKGYSLYKSSTKEEEIKAA